MRQSGSPKNSTKGTHGVLIRMPVDLHEELKRIAAAEHRPVNAQIVYLITQYVESYAEEAAAA